MKPRDITPMLERAIAASHLWSPSIAAEILGRVRASLASSEIDWDRDAGETWGRLLVKSQAVLALSTLVPVAFVRTPINMELLAILDQTGIVALTSSDWERHEFRADPEVVKQAFRRSDWSAAVDPEGFSAAELWWMTI